MLMLVRFVEDYLKSSFEVRLKAAFLFVGVWYHLCLFEVV